MLAAYKKFWTNYINFTGRSSRSDYWWTYLCQVLIILPFSVFLIGNVLSFMISVAPYYNEAGDVVGISEEVLEAQIINQLFSPANIMIWVVLTVYSLAVFIPQLSLTVRRLRDGGFHWAFIFISLIPYVGGLALIVLLVMPTKVEPVVTAPLPEAIVAEEVLPQEVSGVEETDPSSDN